MTHRAPLAALLCIATTAAAAQEATGLLPFTARGNEPFWNLTVTADSFSYTDMEGANLTGPLTPQATEGDAVLFQTAAGTLRLTEKLCYDSMSGMPYPFTVILSRDGTDLPGCAGDPARLLAGEWTALSLDGTALPKGADVTLSFADGRISGIAACNRFSGSYELTGEGLAFGPLASTRMACPPPLMETESAVLAALARISQFDIGPDGTLLLKASESTVLFTATR